MKKIVTLSAFVISLFIIFPLCLSAQTTQEEYNYITKGYKIQIESGLDMKKGYSFKDLGNWGLNYEKEQRSCEFKALIKTGQSKPCAIMMIYQRIDVPNGAKFYICIPSPDAIDQWNQTLNFINENFVDNDKMQNTVIYALLNFTSELSMK